MGASQRTIVKDVEEQTRRWKKRLGIAEHRVHTGKLAKYLEVWDLREGWTGSGYGRMHERSLREIAQQLKLSISSVASRYRSAFKTITGHEFTPHLWRRLLAPIKLSETFNDPAQVLSAPMRRRLTSPVRRPVPETTLGTKDQESRDVGIVESERPVRDDQQSTDFLIDLQDLYEQGLSDLEIAERLEHDVAEIEYIRSRYTEFKENH